jgi:hypothetical protein
MVEGPHKGPYIEKGDICPKVQIYAHTKGNEKQNNLFTL